MDSMHNTIKTSKGGLEIVLGVLIVLIIVVGGGLALAGGYLGIIPQISEVLGTNKPRDLGVSFSSINKDKLYAQTGTKLNLITKETTPQESLKFEGMKASKFTIGSEEISALVNSPWKYFPFKEVQVKVNQDGSIESSGIIKADKIFNTAEALGFSSEEVKKAMNEYNLPVKDLVFYVKFSGKVENNKVDINLAKAEIGRIPLPSFVTEKAVPAAVVALESVIESIPGLYYKSVSFENGKMSVDGTVPAIQTVLTE
jgi:hypothetical protein